MKIHHLEDKPEFSPVIADRCWQAWWRDSDVTLSQYHDAIENMTSKQRLPSAYVAVDDEKYAGSVLLIEDDLPARPLLSPWIAALWVEPAFRKQGVALRLINAARQGAACLEYDRCYLNATDVNSPYYEARGFQMVEIAVGDVNVFSIPSKD